MNQLLVVGEDALSCGIGERIVAEGLPGWLLAKASINTRGITRLVPDLPRYFEQARHVQPVLCIADPDGQCPVELIATWMPRGAPEDFLLRLAVSEAESWLLSDSRGAAEFFGIPVAKMPREPDQLPDPKREVLRLARISKVRTIRQEVVSAVDSNKPGVGYNTHLCKFVFEHWRSKRARLRSARLDKALRRVTQFGARFD